MFEIIKINNKNKELISIFLSKAGEALKTFRYYEKRNLDILSNHIITCVMMQNNEVPVGYGHLDKEGKDIWLGIAVSENLIGKGLGKVIINYLIDFAIKEQVSIVKLSVDINNQQAIRLYEKVGFKIDSKCNEKAFIMKKIINA